MLTLQKRAIRTITFPKPDEHSDPLFKELEILKLTDLVTLALLIYHYCCNFFHLPLKIFQTVATVPSSNTALDSKSTYYNKNIKTNYGKFNICFAAVKL